MRPPFAESVPPLVTAFADQAALALDKAARQRLARQLDVYEDRDRIARDLHDLVIQRVFAAGLALQSVLPRVGEAEARRRIQGVIGQLDGTVRDIRTTIFDLQTTDSAEQRDSTRRRVLDVVTETAGESLAAHGPDVRRRRQPGHRRAGRRRGGRRAGGGQQRGPALRGPRT